MNSQKLAVGIYDEEQKTNDSDPAPTNETPVAPDSTLEKSPDNQNTGENSIKDVSPVATDTNMTQNEFPAYGVLVVVGLAVVLAGWFILRKLNKK